MPQEGQYEGEVMELAERTRRKDVAVVEAGEEDEQVEVDKIVDGIPPVFSQVV